MKYYFNFFIIFLLIVTGCKTSNNAIFTGNNVWNKLKISNVTNSNNKNHTSSFDYAIITSNYNTKISSGSDFYNIYNKDTFMSQCIIDRNLQLIIKEKDGFSIHYNFINLKKQQFYYINNPVYSYTYSVEYRPDGHGIGTALISIDNNAKKVYFWTTNELMINNTPEMYDFVNIYILNYYEDLNQEKFQKSYSIFSIYDKYQDEIKSIEHIEDYLLFEFSY